MRPCPVSPAPPGDAPQAGHLPRAGAEVSKTCCEILIGQMGKSSSVADSEQLASRLQCSAALIGGALTAALWFAVPFP